MVDIVHRVGIRAPLTAVYAALATVEGLSGWWTRDTSGQSAPGGRISFGFRDPTGREIGSFAMEVLALVPQQAVRWRVADGPAEWRGTEIGFQLSGEAEHSIVHFSHRGWREEDDFMAHCSTKWATFLLSLRQMVETGRGQPAPDDLKIDNWN